MKIPHEKFCVLPWVSIEASPIGTVRPCCLARREIVNDTGEKFRLASANLDDIRDSMHMRSLRQSFLNGETASDCERCWSEERAGRTSKRMHTLDRLKHMIDDAEWTEDAKPLMFLDLKLGNICNLKCRICGSWSSSAFATEELQSLPKDRQKSSFHYQMLREGSWPRHSDDFWQQLDGYLSEVRYIEFTGGEPFMIREHFELLERLVELGHAPNIEIHYNTNGTHYPEHAEEIWSNFQHVEIAFSIDDVEQRFEYQRSGASWRDVNQKIGRFREMRERNDNITLQVCCTVSVFNVMYLETVAHWIDRQRFDFVYWNMLHDAPYFSIGSLPTQNKLAVLDVLRDANVRGSTRVEFDRIMDFMRNGAATDGQQMLAKIRELDQRRGQNLAHYMPELARVIGYA